MLEDFSAESKVLFVGEGNFSFSASLVESLVLKHPHSQNANCASPETPVQIKEDNVTQAKKLKTDFGEWFTVSCYEDEKCGSEIKQKNLEILQSHGCNILFELDATMLHKDVRTMKGKYSNIIFMFPHVGGKMRIEKNRALLLAFLSSCREVLESDGKVTIALARGQGGTPMERVKRKESDTWKVVDLAHEAGFILTLVDFLDVSKFPSYSQTGYRSLEKGFHCEDSLLHVFAPASLPPLLPLPHHSSPLLLSSASQECPSPTSCVSLYPPSHCHHLSMWLGPDSTNLSIEQVLHTAYECLPGVTVTVKEVDRYSGNGRASLTVEVTYTSTLHALGASLAWHLHLNVLGQSLANVHGVIIR